MYAGTIVTARRNINCVYEDVLIFFILLALRRGEEKNDNDARA